MESNIEAVGSKEKGFVLWRLPLLRLGILPGFLLLRNQDYGVLRIQKQPNRETLQIDGWRPLVLSLGRHHDDGSRSLSPGLDEIVEVLGLQRK